MNTLYRIHFNYHFFLVTYMIFIRSCKVSFSCKPGLIPVLIVCTFSDLLVRLVVLVICKRRL